MRTAVTLAVWILLSQPVFKVYRDFELRLKFRLRGENVNAGVQFRSVQLVAYDATPSSRRYAA
jgi:hypothetical protein